MNYCLILFLTVFSLTVQCAIVPYDFFVQSKYSDTKFCQSILLPSVNTLKKSLDASFINTIKNDTQFNENYHLDLCCRSFYKCNSYKCIELNYTNDENFGNCDCEYYFRSCLNRLNTTLSSEIAIVHTVNTRKCYAHDYPIIKCIKYELQNVVSKNQFLTFLHSLFDNDKFSNRCLKYQLNENKTKSVQLFDLPFQGITFKAFNGMCTKTISLFCIFLC